jgi:hypothetical protein
VIPWWNTLSTVTISWIETLEVSLTVQDLVKMKEIGRKNEPHMKEIWPENAKKTVEAWTRLQEHALKQR